MVDADSKTGMRTPVETHDPWSGNVDARLAHALVEGGVSKLGFGDENVEIVLWLDSSPSAHVGGPFLNA